MFGVKESLIATLTQRQGGTYPDGGAAPDTWTHLAHAFGLKPAR